MRFQDLSAEIQDRVVRCFDQGLVPDFFDVPGMTDETIRHWYANRALLKFWVQHRELRQRD